MNVPLATYRLELRQTGFIGSAELAAYLAALGISDVYVSPLTASCAGSLHGYDVVDPTRLDPSLGTREDFDGFVAALRRHRLRLIADMVVNHMCASAAENSWWRDLLELGPRSQFFKYFDVYWTGKSRPRALLPVLGAPFDEVVRRRELRVEPRPGGFVLTYYERELPLRAEALPDAARALLENQSATAEELDAVVAGLNEPAALRAIVEGQCYRPVYWRRSADHAFYRRFFDISDLVGLRVEDDAVFEAVHRLVFALVAEGAVTGVRIDHIDGLRDPTAYLDRLVRRLAELRPENSAPPYIVVEKILEEGEALHGAWPVSGTTGYDFLNAATRVLVHPKGAAELVRVYESFVGHSTSFTHVEHESRRQVLTGTLYGDVRRVAEMGAALALVSDRFRSLDGEEVEQALIEVVASLPVYRTYVGQTDREISAVDARTVQNAVDTAKVRRPDLSRSALELWRSVLLLDLSTWSVDHQLAREIVMRLQQLTGPAAAKGLEDTALYRYFPLTALNEVGGRPDRLSLEVSEWHAFNEQRLRERPHTMNASSTHDTKRGEDVRARLAVLSELPGRWGEALWHWRALNAGHRNWTGGRELPSRAEEYLLYQTIVGTWPDPKRTDDWSTFADRIEGFMRKAVREAKLETSWWDPDITYEEALSRFVRAALDVKRSPAFVRDVDRFVREVRLAGWQNSLSQLLLKVASPGLPDFYQGTELWEDSLVDPDNRRPVDFARRRAMLARLVAAPRGRAALVDELIGDIESGALKLFVTWAALELRGRLRPVFERGAYVPLEAHGDHAGHLIAFARVLGETAVIAVAGRWYAALGARRALPGPEAWGDTSLALPASVPRGPYRSAFLGRCVEAVRRDGARCLGARDVLVPLPVALLYTE